MRILILCLLVFLTIVSSQNYDPEALDYDDEEAFVLQDDPMREGLAGIMRPAEERRPEQEPPTPPTPPTRPGEPGERPGERPPGERPPGERPGERPPGERPPVSPPERPPVSPPERPPVSPPERPPEIPDVPGINQYEEPGSVGPLFTPHAPEEPQESDMQQEWVDQEELEYLEDLNRMQQEQQMRQEEYIDDRYRYDADGYDAEGYDRDGFDREGYNRDGISRYGGRRGETLYDRSRWCSRWCRADDDSARRTTYFTLEYWRRVCRMRCPEYYA